MNCYMMNRSRLRKQISGTRVLILIYTWDFNDWHLSASLHLVMHALLTFLEANLHVQLTCFDGHNSIMMSKIQSLHWLDNTWKTLTLLEIKTNKSKMRSWKHFIVFLLLYEQEQFQESAPELFQGIVKRKSLLFMCMGVMKLEKRILFSF